MLKPPNDEPFLKARRLLEKLAFNTSPIPVEKIARALSAQVRGFCSPSMMNCQA